MINSGLNILAIILFFFLLNSCKKDAQRTTNFSLNSKKQVSNSKNENDSVDNKKFCWDIDSSDTGEIIKKEYVFLGNEKFLNQKIFLNKNGDTIKNRSFFFNLYLPDTLKLGRNIGELKLNSNNKAQKKYLMVVIENEYGENEIRKDTFLQDENRTWFGVFAYRRGIKMVKGTIIEQLVKTKRLTEDSLQSKIIYNKSYFEKEVFVKDSIIK